MCIRDRKKTDQPKSELSNTKKKSDGKEDAPEKPTYKPEFAHPTEAMQDLLLLRGVHPLYAVFLMKHLGIADRTERILAFESILELSRSLGKPIRVPHPDILPPGPLATTRLDSQLLKLGLATAEELGATKEEDEDEKSSWHDDDWVPILTLPHKLHRLFQYDFPGVHDLSLIHI